MHHIKTVKSVLCSFYFNSQFYHVLTQCCLHLENTKMNPNFPFLPFLDFMETILLDNNTNKKRSSLGC